MTSSTGPAHVPASIMRTGEYWVIVPDAGGDVIVLNDTGRAAFELCDGSRSPDGIAEVIAAAAGADLVQVSEDVQEFLKQIEEAGLLEHS